MQGPQNDGPDSLAATIGCKYILGGKYGGNKGQRHADKLS